MSAAYNRLLIWFRAVCFQSLACAASLTPHPANSAGKFIDWSVTLGEWNAQEAGGSIQLLAMRLRYEEPRQQLKLHWLRWNADAREFKQDGQSVAVEICGESYFHSTDLLAYADASPRLIDMVLKVNFLSEQPLAGPGRTFIAFIELDKQERNIRTFNCRGTVSRPVVR